MKATLLFSFSIFTAANSSAMEIVHGTAVQLDRTNFYGANYIISVEQDVDGDPTSLFFSKLDNAARRRTTLTPVAWTVDEAADYYLAPFGALVSKSNIESKAFMPFFEFDNPSSLTLALPSTFYLAINTGQGFSTVFGASRPNRDVFGWARIENTTTGLTLVDSVVAYGSSGVYIGTASAIPEPSIYQFTLLGVFGITYLVKSRKPKWHLKQLKCSDA